MKFVLMVTLFFLVSMNSVASESLEKNERDLYNIPKKLVLYLGKILEETGRCSFEYKEQIDKLV